MNEAVLEFQEWILDLGMIRVAIQGKPIINRRPAPF
jgi:hypothetical protein